MKELLPSGSKLYRLYRFDKTKLMVTENAKASFDWYPFIYIELTRVSFNNLQLQPSLHELSITIYISVYLSINLSIYQ